MIYYGRNKLSHQKYNLYFALFLFSLLGYLSGTYLGKLLYNTYDRQSVIYYGSTVIEAIFVFFIGYFLVLYISDFFSFPDNINKKIRILIILLGVVLSFTLTSPIMKGSFYVDYLFAPVVSSVGIIQVLLFYIILKYSYALSFHFYCKSSVSKGLKNSPNSFI